MPLFTPVFFLSPVFSLQHTAEESQLLSNFNLVPSRPNNTFSHVLYVLHRDSVGAKVGSLRTLSISPNIHNKLF